MNNSKLQHPARGQVYTLRQMHQELMLRDTPHHMIFIAGQEAVIQTSHITEEELLQVEGFADTKWEYRYETNEWIPIFKYVDERPITDFVDYESEIDPWTEEVVENGFWVTPKGFPREQYVSTLKF